VAALRPRTLEELRLAHGIGRHKAERYGKGFIEVIASLTTEPAGPGRDHGAGER